MEIFVQLCQAQKLLLEQFESQNNSIFDDLFDEQKSNVAPQWTSNSTSQSQNARVRIHITNGKLKCLHKTDLYKLICFSPSIIFLMVLRQLFDC